MTQQCNWNGQTFGIYNPSVSWNDVPGVYIFAQQSPIGGWVPKYIGQALSLKQRLGQHERWEEARRLGATHVHATIVRTQPERDRLERELIQHFQPALNTQLKQV